jgi:hypothetical protein
MRLVSKFPYRGRLRRRPGSYRPELLRLEDRNLPGFLAPLAFDAGSGPTAVAVGDSTATASPTSPSPTSPPGP